MNIMIAISLPSPPIGNHFSIVLPLVEIPASIDAKGVNTVIQISVHVLERLVAQPHQ